jgi:hypothetical protein
MPPVLHHRLNVRLPAPATPAAVVVPAPAVTVTPPVAKVVTASPRGVDAFDGQPKPATTPPVRGYAADAELDILTRMMKAKGENVVDVIGGPSSTTANAMTFDFGPGGRLLQPGDLLMLGVPAEWRKRTVGTVVLVHRQDEAMDRGLDAATGRDASPGLTAVNIHSADDGTWRKWNCPWGGNGKWGAKFAERRPEHDPEFESMFEWNIHGHHDADKERSTLKHAVHANGVRLACVGDDPVIVHKLIIDFIGERPTSTMEKVFTPGTNLGDWETGEGRTFGGGQQFRGTYPDALQLGTPTGGAGAAGLPDGWKLHNGMLEVELPPGKVITGVDLACGDTKPDGLRNKDGGWGTSGKSRLSMGVQDALGNVAWFVDRIGVPPQGVLSGAPTSKDYVTRPGDKLVIRSEVDPINVMATRVGLKDPVA